LQRGTPPVRYTALRHYLNIDALIFNGSRRHPVAPSRNRLDVIPAIRQLPQGASQQKHRLVQVVLLDEYIPPDGVHQRLPRHNHPLGREQYR